MQTLTPCLWFNNNAEEAVEFYKTVFKNVTVNRTARYDAASAEASGMPEGSVLTVDFQLEGYAITALNGGPIFKLTPAISFFVHHTSAEELDEQWNKLLDGGSVMMQLGEYPYSKRYGWLKDKFGVTWQMMLVDKPMAQTIVPCLLFTGEKFGKAGEAVELYTSVFPNSKIDMMTKATSEPPYNNPDAVMFSSVTLFGKDQLTAMDGPGEHAFSFTEGISLQVECDTQEEIDRYWNALSAVPESEMCGWLKDKFGVSWQIVPKVLIKMLADPDAEKASRAMKAMLSMKKLDIAKLQAAYNG